MLKKKIVLPIKLICLLLVLFMFKAVNAQQLVYLSDTNRVWMDMIRTGEYSVQEIQLKAHAYFNAHPEIDSIAPHEKTLYRRWSNYWGNRSVFKNGDTVFTKINDILAHVANLDFTTGPVIGKKWALITPDQDDYQDLGVVTSIWNDPTNINYILAGTESSGLWKTTDGGQNWSNITDSYTGINSYTAYYPFGVLSVVVKPSDHNTILIAASIPTFDGAYGIGILKSLDGGNTWVKTKLFINQTSSNAGVEFKNPIYKIKFDPFNNNIAYAVGVFNIYATDDLFEHNQTILIGDGVGTPFVNPVNPLENYEHMKINDFEVLNTDYIFTSNTGSKVNSNCFRKLVVSTYAYNNISAQLVVGFLRYNGGCNFTTRWTNETGKLTGNTAINWIYTDVISLSLPNSFLDNDPQQSNIYVGYKNQGFFFTSNFNIDLFTIGQQYITGPVFNIATATNQAHHLSLNYTDNDDLNPCAGFGQFYNRFKHVRDLFIVGGYGITFLTEDPSITPGGLRSSTSNYTFGHLPILPPYIDENSGKNKKLHLGIKDIFISPVFQNSINYEALVGTEGGISKLEFELETVGSHFDVNVTNLSNINGKGLAIQQFNDITCTKNNSKDIIVGSAMHNGYWGRNTTDANWINTWIDNGARVVINDYTPNYLYHITYFPPLYANIPLSYGSTNPSFMRSDNGYELDNNCNGWLCNAVSGSHVYPKTVFNYDLGGLISHTWVYNLPLFVMNNQPNTLFMGVHDVLMSNLNGQYNPQSWTSLTSFTEYEQCLGIKALTLAGTNTLYAAFERPTWSKDLNVIFDVAPLISEVKKLWKIDMSIPGSPISTDITPNIGCGDAICWSNITDIVVNPDYPSEIWMSMGSFMQVATTRVLHSLNGGASWSDFSTGLTAVPVNCIRLIKDDIDPTNYLLVVGTDVGVYKRGKNETIWTRYSDGLPTVIVTDIEIWEKGRKIRAATWGRGIWEAEVPCMSSTNQSYIFNENKTTTWTTDKVIDNIDIVGGSTLIIKSRVRFNAGGYIRVEQGANLIVDGGILYACPGVMWQGVTVYGDRNHSQFSNGKHGIVTVKNGGTIRDAFIAINTLDPNSSGKGAGIIYAEDAYFINNQIGINMRPYTNSTPYGKVFKEFSYFKNCKFINDDLYHDMNYGFQTFIKLDQIYKIDILGCKFDNRMTAYAPLNSYTAFNKQGTGILSFTSIYTINNYNSASGIINSEFKNLNYGINASTQDISRYIFVKNASFDNNCQGAHLLGIYNSSFTDNQFKTPDCYDPYLDGSSINGAYGLYLEGCSGYTVENNYFDKTSNVAKAAYGLLIANTGTAYNRIYNNNFKNIYKNATQAQGKNDLLQIKCNDYSLNKRDISVINFPLPGVPFSTIASSQGAQVGVPPDPQKQAGNTFSHDNSIFQYSDFYSSSQPIKYYFHNSPPTNPYYTYNIIKHPDYPTFYKPTTCPSIAASGGSIGGGGSVNPSPILLGDISQSTIQLNSAKVILNIWKDGGNTEGLKEEVKYAYPWDSYQLYGDLIAASPYLSDSVLIEAINNDKALPDEMLTIVLEANPQFLHSNEIMSALDKVRRFSDETLEEIKNLVYDSISPLENLEADVMHYATERKVYVDLLKQYYLADTTGTCSDSLISLLANENDIDSKYELVFAYLNKKEQQNVTDLMSIIQQMITPGDQYEGDRWAEMNQIVPIIYNLSNDIVSFDQLTSSEQNYVYYLAENNNELPGTLAKAIRIQTDTSFHYKEPIYPDDSQQNRTMLVKKTKKIQNKQELLKILPNPAKEYVIVDFKNNTPAKEVLLTVTDMQGRLQMKQNLKNTTNSTLINIQSLTNGIYNFSIFVDGKQKASNKIVIQH